MMKRVLLLLTAILTIAFLCGCSTGKTDLEDIDMQDKEIENKVELVTKEQIMEYFGFSESELEGIDVEAVVAYCHYTEEDIHKFPKDLFLDGLKLDNIMLNTDVGYLFNGGQPDEPITSSQIKNVAFLVGENDRNDYWQIRVQDKKSYYNLGFSEHMDLENESLYSGELTNEYINELLSCLEKAKLHKWKDEYAGNNGDTTGDWRWQLGIELMDGTVYSWEGYGMFGNNRPAEYESIEAVVRKCPLNLTNVNNCG